MQKKTFGRTGLAVSQIVLGGGAVGGIIFKDGLESGYNAVKEAMDLGINWIDSAPVYGGGKSEEFIGKIIGMLDTKPIITTKVMVRPEEMDNIEYTILKSVESSLKTLSLSSVDILQLHNKIDNKEFDAESLSCSDIFKKKGVLDTLQKLKDEHTVGNIGFTGLGDAKALHKMISDGRFDMFQAYINPLNPSALYKKHDSYDHFDYSGIIRAANAKNMGISTIRVLAAGVLAGVKNIPDSKPLAQTATFPREYERLARLQKVLDLSTQDVYRLAMQLALCSDELGVAVLGFAKPEHMYQATKTLEGLCEDNMLADFKKAYESGRLG